MALSTDIVPSDAQSGDMLTTMNPSTGEMARIGRLVRLERQRQGLRQDDLAKMAGCNRNTVTAVESGRSANPKSLPDILTALGLSATELLIDGPPTVPSPGAAPPLAHLTDSQLGNEAMRLLAELTARLAARPTPTGVPARGSYGTISAVETPPDNGHHHSAR
jgi:transcriptional regulator with XRE-family HTH domain